MFRPLKNCEVEIMGKAANTAEVGRKRTFATEESTSSVNFKTRRLTVVVTPDDSDTMVSSGNSMCDSSVDSRCSSTGLNNELAKDSSGFADLEANEVMVKFLAATSVHSVDFTERRGMTEMKPRKPIFRSCSTAEKMPTEAELEDFFAAAEKSLQKQFLDKYNYDIVKDEPKVGRYEWVKIQIKPRPSVTRKKKKQASTV